MDLPTLETLINEMHKLSEVHKNVDNANVRKQVQETLVVLNKKVITKLTDYDGS